MSGSLCAVARNWRPNLVAALTGVVLEIGVGQGENLPHYRQASRVWAVEPDPVRAARAQIAARAATLARGIPIQVKVAPAEALPYADAQFDSVVSSLVFCSVTDQRRALGEIRRVLKDGGTLHMVEHVRPQNGFLARVAAGVTPYWRTVAHNCHLDRPTLAVLRELGWHVQVVQQVGVFVRLRATCPRP